MGMPSEVKKMIAVLNSYKWDDTTGAFNIFHLYPKGLAYPDGFYDSQWFECIGFNTTTMTKKDLGLHDQMNFQGKKPLFRPSIRRRLIPNPLQRGYKSNE